MELDHSPLLSFQRAPEYGFYVQGDDRLSVTAYSAVASLVVRFSGYFLDVRGTINQYAMEIVPTSDRLATTATQFFGEGWILSCTANLLTGSALRGQCYVRARIQRGTGASLVPITQLLGGYVSNQYSPTFPYGKIEGSLEGGGMMRAITGTDPAAGTEVSETVPAGARWRLCSIQLSFASDATVANRNVGLVYDNGTTAFAVMAANFYHTASLTIGYCWAKGAILSSGLSLAQFTAAALDALLLPGYRIRSTTALLQVTDNYAAPQLLVEEWLEA